jgi:hypothetical protein
MEPTDLQKLDPVTRCFALVGWFLHAWASMESSLHGAIGEALVIEPRKLQILCANMRFRDKLNVLATLIDVAPDFQTDEKRGFRKKINELAELSAHRNMMVHNPFGPDGAQKGVEFLRVKAKGKFELPNEVWDEARFDAGVTDVHHYQALLIEIATRFHDQPLPPQSYSAALQRFLPYESFEGRTSVPMIMKRHMSPSPAPEVHGKPDGE